MLRLVLNSAATTAAVLMVSFVLAPVAVAQNETVADKTIRAVRVDTPPVIEPLPQDQPSGTSVDDETCDTRDWPGS